MDRLKEPIINGEFDAVTGRWWCPYGCGPTTDDPWEAMWHEVGHSCLEEEIEELKEDYGLMKVSFISCGFVVELAENESPPLRVWQGPWQRRKSRRNLP